MTLTNRDVKNLNDSILSLCGDVSTKGNSAFIIINKLPQSSFINAKSNLERSTISTVSPKEKSVYHLQKINGTQ